MNPPTPAASGSGEPDPLGTSRHLLILVGLFISTTGDEIALVALALKAAELTGQLASVSVLLVAGLLPGVLLSHHIARAADRFSVKHLLGCALLVQALIAGGAALVSGQWALVVIAALLGGFGSLSQAAVMVLIPRLYAGKQLVQANSLFETARSAGSVIGPLAAGVLITLIGTRGALLVDAGSFVAALMIVVVAIPTFRRQEEATSADAEVPAASGLATGLRQLWGNLAIRLALIPLLVIVVSTSVMNVALPFFTSQISSGGGFYGVAVAAWSAGLLIGPQLLLTRLRDAAPGRLVLVSAMTVGIGLAGAACTTWPVLIVGFFVLGGAGNSLVNVSMRSLIMRNSPDHRRGSIAAAYGATMQTAVIIGFLAAAPAPESAARWVILIGGVLAVLAGAAGLLVERSAGKTAVLRIGAAS